MGIQELVNLITDNGIGIICVAYLIYDHLHFGKVQEDILKEQSKSLSEISTTLTKMNERISSLELCRNEKK